MPLLHDSVFSLAQRDTVVKVPEQGVLAQHSSQGLDTEAAWPRGEAYTAALLNCCAGPSRQPAGACRAELSPEAAWPWEQAEAAVLLASGELQITWSPALLRLP